MVGASVAGLTGGSATGGALAAGAAEAGAPLTAGQSQLVQQLASTVIGAAGAAIGGGSAASGGATALAGQQFNRELHPNELAALNKAKEGKTPEEQLALDNAACAKIQCWITGTADGSENFGDHYNATIRDQVETFAATNPTAFAAASATLGATGLFVSTAAEAQRDAVVQAKVDLHGGQAGHLTTESRMFQPYLSDLNEQLSGRAQLSTGQFLAGSAQIYGGDFANGFHATVDAVGGQATLLGQLGLAGYVASKTDGVLPSAADWASNPSAALLSVAGLPAKTIVSLGGAAVSGTGQYLDNLNTIATKFYDGTATPRTGADLMGVGGDVALAWAGEAGLKALQGVASGVKVVEATVPAGELFGPPSLTTKPNQAYFWSGLGPDGADIASGIAKGNGGVTLEDFAQAQGLKLPEYDRYNPASVKAWWDASRVYAEGASGDVHFVPGKNISPGSAWVNVEFNALKQNPKVTSIISKNPATGEEVLLWKKVTPP